MIYYSFYLLLANIFLKKLSGANFKGRGHVLSGPFPGASNRIVIYTTTRLCAASVERRASSDIAITAD